MRSSSTTRTVCPYCGCGCGMVLPVVDGRVGRPMPDAAHPLSEGRLCIKGWTAHEHVNSSQRLTRPWVRKDGALEEASWEEALDLVSRRLLEVRDRRGPQALGFLCSAKCTNEENYLLQKLARAVFQTNNVDHCARLCHAPSVAGLVTALGSGAMCSSIPEIEESDCILVTGSNTSENHPIVATRVIRAQQRGAKLILVDPRAIPLARFADVHARPRPGTDVAWVNGLVHVILAEGWEDRAFVESRTEGIERLREAVAAYTPERVEAISGIGVAQLRQIAELYAKAERASILYAMGVTQHTSGTDNVLALANLVLATGQVGRRGTGINPLRGQNNVQGACDMGGLVNVFPGYQPVTDSDHRRRFAAAWGVDDLPGEPGTTLVEMMNAAAEGELAALFVLAENPVLSDPDVHHVREALGNLEFLVVQDIFLTETAALADVVLPGTCFAERSGTVTATDRSVQLVRKAVDPPGDARADWSILCDVARRCGATGFDFGDPAEVLEEVARLTPIYGGILPERLEREWLRWPCPTPDHPGTTFLHEAGFPRGKGRFTAVDHREPAEEPDDAYPFLLTTGRVTFHWHTGSMTRRSPSLEREVGACFVEVSPRDAEPLGLEDGDAVTITSRRGSIVAEARVEATVSPGVVFVPFHFAESAANELTHRALDPVAKIPEYKVCAVALARAAEVPTP